MKSYIQISVFLLGIIVFASFFPIQAKMMTAKATQQSIDQTVAWLMISGSVLVIGSLLSFVPWSEFRPSNFRLK